MLPNEAIEEFKKIYLARFDVVLSDEEAMRRANNLIGLYKAVYDEPVHGPIHPPEKDRR
jgi:hypothetical protein